ncbi:MAG: acetyl-CoA carboxylase carboxyltransferase subunit beta [Calditrichaeota bacterium]|nr:acetyl-CoA carboxylase carboxyltransferase subunit beta [Calditrichota bacterium]
MDWFKRRKTGLKPQKKKDMPDGLWEKCLDCGEIIYRTELEKNLWVCQHCNYHFRITSKDYIRILSDKDSWEEFNANIKSVDPLKFKDSKRYTERYQQAVDKTGLNDAVVTGRAKIEGVDTSLAVMEFGFIGGSMGSVVGEKIARAIDVAIEEQRGFVLITASGGARMMEGALSLMQMAKTSAKLAQLSDNGLPCIIVITDPTTGGTTASFAMLGDIIIAEPNALIGFAGQRVIKQTIGEDLPKGFQRSQFLLEHGFVDVIVSRNHLKEEIAKMLNFFFHKNKVS